MAKPTVAVFGGGVGGLTVAHELSKFDFSVDVYERRSLDRIGGKSRSVRVPGTGADGRDDCPGEHGFVFFPASTATCRR